VYANSDEALKHKPQAHTERKDECQASLSLLVRKE